MLLCQCKKISKQLALISLFLTLSQTFIIFNSSFACSEDSDTEIFWFNSSKADGVVIISAKAVRGFFGGLKSYDLKVKRIFKISSKFDIKIGHVFSLEPPKTNQKGDDSSADRYDDSECGSAYDPFDIKEDEDYAILIKGREMTFPRILIDKDFKLSDLEAAAKRKFAKVDFKVVKNEVRNLRTKSAKKALEYLHEQQEWADLLGYTDGNLEESLRMLEASLYGELKDYKKADSLLANSNSVLAMYNRACFMGRQNNISKSIEYLFRLADKFEYNLNRKEINRYITLMSKDQDLAGVRNDPRFKTVYAKFQELKKLASQ
ncbi:MAG: hypothetical protein NT027_15925 [Proteobacteria bacterium]|nr:hypothetical protein [Pseudomonadota bacterium]